MTDAGLLSGARIAQLEGELSDEGAGSERFVIFPHQWGVNRIPAKAIALSAIWVITLRPECREFLEPWHH